MTSIPRWTRVLLRRLAPNDRVDEVLGDLEEAHRRRVEARSSPIATLLTAVEALDIGFALVRQRVAGRSRFSLLDFKLGLRMLIRYPGLTVVGGLAMAFGIWVGALTFEVVREIVAPELPLQEGERIVGIRNVDVRAGRTTVPFLEDFATWRQEVGAVAELGAFRSVSRNLNVGGAIGEPVDVAAMSAAGFAVARVPPLLGRTLQDADEEIGAPAVVVIGYDLWQARFAGDADIIGVTVGVGSTPRTIVGVMPAGFTFPIAHQVWTPLRPGPVSLQPGEGDRVAVFGRLAPGTSMEEAQAELDVLGARRAAAFPDALGLVRPQVMPYARAVVPLPDIGLAGLLATNAFMVMLLLLTCGNVALLIFARAATRERELAVRSALGAGRTRIVGQLFAETLVLAGLAAVVGLSGAGLGKAWYVAMLEADAGGAIPFWVGGGIAPTTVLYLCGLAVLGAAVAGIGPALKVTGRRVESRLRSAAAGVTGLRLSGLWSHVIVVQVAVTVAFPATAFFCHRYVQQIQHLDLGFAADQYLSARVEVDDGSRPVSADRVRSLYAELEERVAAEPGVVGVTLANRLPGDAHARRPIEIESAETSSDDLAVHRAAEAAVGEDFFRVLGAPVRVGRAFDADDAAVDHDVVIVNQAFVEGILGGRSALGRRLRYPAREGQAPGRWLEIAGVAEDLGMVGGDFELRDEPGIYHPLTPSDPDPVQMAVHVGGDPEAFASRLRVLAADVDTDLRLHDIARLDRISESRWRETAFLARLLTGVSGVALILSLTTIYSVMTFTVSRRTREIGVRVALGASRQRIVRSIFRAPLIRVAIGIVLGMALVSLVTWGLVGTLAAREIAVVVLYSAAMLAVCLFACVVPTRRALSIEPTEALGAEG